VFAGPKAAGTLARSSSS